MKYKIADLIVEMEPDEKTRVQAEKYLTDQNAKVDIYAVSQGKKEYEDRKYNGSFESFRYITLGSSFYRQLLDFGGCMLHSSAVVVDGKAYLFSAPCGTGKSTHTQFYLELFGNERAFIINDDKPAIKRGDDGKFYVHGTPWSGKHDMSEDTSALLQGICFLQRDKENWIRRIDPQDAFLRMYHQCIRNLDKEYMVKQLNLFEEITKKIPSYEMGCNPTVDAAKVSFGEMSKEEI